MPGHQPHDPLRGHDDPRAPQLEPHPPVPVAAAAVLERLPLQGEQPLVAVRPGHRAQLVEVRAARQPHTGQQDRDGQAERLDVPLTSIAFSLLVRFSGSAPRPFPTSSNAPRRNAQPPIPSSRLSARSRSRPAASAASSARARSSSARARSNSTRTRSNSTRASMGASPSRITGSRPSSDILLFQCATADGSTPARPAASVCVIAPLAARLQQRLAHAPRHRTPPHGLPASRRHRAHPPEQRPDTPRIPQLPYHVQRAATARQL